MAENGDRKLIVSNSMSQYHIRKNIVTYGISASIESFFMQIESLNSEQVS